MDQNKAIEEILSRIEITEQIHRYCYFFDSNDTDGLRQLFTEEAEVDYGPEVPTLVGIEAIMTSISRGLTSTFSATSHHISNIIITFDGNDRAHVTSYLYAWHRYHGKPEVGYLWGRYSHMLRREIDGWRITHLKLLAVATQDFHRETMHAVPRAL